MTPPSSTPTTVDLTWPMVAFLVVIALLYVMALVTEEDF